MGEQRDAFLAGMPGVAALGEDFCNIPNIRALRESDVTGYGGWAALIARAAQVEDSQLAGTGMVLAMDQVKEKFGTLRLYCHVEPFEAAVVEDGDGGDWRDGDDGVGGVDGAETSPFPPGVDPGEAMGVAENASGVMCMGCGMPALSGGSGWISTLCPSCRKGKDGSPDYLWGEVLPRVTEVSPAHMAFFTAWREWLAVEGWRHAVERAVSGGHEPPERSSYGADGAEERIVAILSGLTLDDVMRPMGEGGPCPLHYPLGAGFLALCDGMGLVAEPPLLDGMAVSEVLASIGVDGDPILSFWEGRALAAGVEGADAPGASPSP